MSPIICPVGFVLDMTLFHTSACYLPEQALRWFFAEIAAMAGLAALPLLHALWGARALLRRVMQICLTLVGLSLAWVLALYLQGGNYEGSLMILPFLVAGYLFLGTTLLEIMLSPAAHLGAGMDRMKAMWRVWRVSIVFLCIAMFALTISLVVICRGPNDSFNSVLVAFYFVMGFSNTLALFVARFVGELQTIVVKLTKMAPSVDSKGDSMLDFASRLYKAKIVLLGIFFSNVPCIVAICITYLVLGTFPMTFIIPLVFFQFPIILGLALRFALMPLKFNRARHSNNNSGATARSSAIVAKGDNTNSSAPSSRAL